MKRPIAIAVFLAAVVVLCIAGTKISRLTQTRTIQGDSLFVVVTGSTDKATRAIEATNLIEELARFPTWTNSVIAIGTSVGVKTNGVTVGSTVTTIDIITGSNTVVQATNAAGVASIQINASATGGSGTTETQWIPDSTQFYTNASGGFGIKSAAVVTNLGVHSGSILSVPLTINGVAGQDGNLFNVKNYLGNILFGLSYDGSMINPILDSTSTAGYVWTATGTDGVGDWVAPEVTTAILNLATNAVYVIETTRNAAVSNALVALIASSTNFTTINSGFANLGTAIISNLARIGRLDVLTNANLGSLVVTNAADFIGRATFTSVVTNNDRVWLNERINQTDPTLAASFGDLRADKAIVTNNVTLPGNVVSSGSNIVSGAFRLPSIATNTLLFIGGQSNVVGLGVGANLAVSGGNLTGTASGGTNYPPAIRIGTNVTIGSGVRQFVTLQTNATFNINFEGTPNSGETVRVGISNHSASLIFMTNRNGGTVTDCYDTYQKTNVTAFQIAANSIVFFDFAWFTNFNLGTVAQYLIWSSEFQPTFIAGTNTSLTTNGNTVAVNTAGELNNWSQYPTNVWNSRQGGSEVLSNLIVTVARNVTNVVSLSTSNATSNPLTNSYTTGVLTLYGIEQGTNAVIYNNGSNLVINAQPAGGGIVTNGNQFGASTTLTIKDGARLTNTVLAGTTVVSNQVTPLVALAYSDVTNVIVDMNLGYRFKLDQTNNCLLVLTNWPTTHTAELYIRRTQTNGGTWNTWYDSTRFKFNVSPVLPDDTNVGRVNITSGITDPDWGVAFAVQTPGFRP